MSGDWQARCRDAVGRLVHPSVTDSAEHRRQLRFIAVCLVAPFLVVTASWQNVAMIAGLPLALAAICAAFGLYWLAAVSVAATGQRALAEAATLGGSVVVAAAVAIAAGGLASPVALALAALAAEPWFVARSRAALRVGLAGMAVALSASILLPLWFIPQGLLPEPAAWHWIAPALYLMTLWVRGRRDGARVAEDASDQPHGAVAELPLSQPSVRFAPDGNVDEASPTLCAMLNVPAHVLAQSGLFDRVHVADRVGYLTCLADCRETGEERSCEIRLRVAGDGDSVGVPGFRSFLLKLVPGRDGNAPTGVLTDNQAMADLRAELEAARSAIEKAELAKGHFLGVVSHELRTPLNAIIGFSDMLLEGMHGPFATEGQREYVGLVKQAGDHLLAVVNSILDVSKIESGAYSIEPERFDLADAVRGSVAMLELQAARKSIAIDVASRDCAEIVADRRAVQQILVNLVGNAVKFTPEGGRVGVAARIEGDMALLTVSDTGIGMAADDLRRIGRPFTQIENDYTRRYEGAGLGLSLVAGLVRLHGGSIEFESEQGAGTLVTVKLPAAGPRRAAAAGGRRVVPMAAASHRMEDADEDRRKIA